MISVVLLGVARRPTVIHNSLYTDYYPASDPRYQFMLDETEHRTINLTLPGCALQWSHFSSLERAGLMYWDPPVTNFLTAPLGKGSVINLLDNVTYKTWGGAPYDPEAAKVLTPSASGQVEVGECSVEPNDVDKWTTQVIGPFNSTGGFDWWVFSYGDVGHTFADAQSNRSRITAVQVQPIDEDGNMIDTEGGRGWLHEHHVVFNLETAGVMWNDFDYFDWFFFGHNGDIDRSGLIGIADFHALNARRPMCYDMSKKLNVGGFINDARPINSPGTIWYYAISVRMSYLGCCEAHVLKGHDEPLSQMGVAGLGYGSVAMAHSMVQAFLTPNDVETIFYNVFRLPFSGYFVNGAWHVHGINWRRSWLLTGVPSDYGLPYVSSTDYTTMPIPLSKLGYTRDEFTARMDSLPWLCRALDKGAGPIDGAADCNVQIHLIKGEHIVNVGLFGGFPRNVTESGNVAQHMGPHITFAADDHKTHNVLCFSGPNLDEFELGLSRIDFIRTAMPSLRSRINFDLAWSTLTLLLAALLIWLPALCFSQCLSRHVGLPAEQPEQPKVVAIFTLLFGLCSYLYVQTILRKFVGLSLDVELLQVPPNPLLLFLCAFIPPLLLLTTHAMRWRYSPLDSATSAKKRNYVNVVSSHDLEFARAE